MKNSKKTKRALLASVMSVVLCFTMLLGTTFAWFTDSVTSGQNKIVAGNLDVELYHQDKATGTTPEKVIATTELFDDAELWEPGVIVWEKFNVENAGNLALKYVLNLNVGAATEVNGKTLADVLKVAVVDETFTYTRDEVHAITDWTSLANFTESGELLAKADGATENPSDEYGIIIYWEPTDNDNLFNMNNDNEGKVLDIEIGVALYATQLVHENDSFDNTYDSKATYDSAYYTPTEPAKTVENNATVYNVSTVGELLWFSGKTTNALGDTVVINIMNDIDLGGSEFETLAAYYGDSLNVNGNGYTISNVAIVDGGHNGDVGAASMFYPLGGAALEVNDMKFDSITVTGSGVNGFAAVLVSYCEGTATLNNVDVNNATVNGLKSCGVLAGHVTTAITINECDVTNSAVSVTEDRAGGWIGRVVGTATITNSTVDAATASSISAVDGWANKYIGQRYNDDTIITIDGVEYYNPVAANDATALTNAIADVPAGGTATINLAEGTYTVPSVSGKDITIVGSGKDTVIDRTKTSNLSNTDVIIENATIKGTDTGYIGFHHSASETYIDCIFEGQFWAYGTEADFINCTFNQTSADSYNIWTYGSSDITFDGCTFNSAGKSALVYNEGGSADPTYATFNNCTFNASEAVEGKAAIEIDSTYQPYVVTINNCVANGFANGSKSGNPLWNHKLGAQATITVDGVTQ